MLDLQFLNYSNIKGNEAEFEENWFFMWGVSKKTNKMI